MRKRIEFPLFELLVIIILMLVLVVFALPKFLDVGREVRINTLNTIALNLSSVNRLLYSRAVIKNIQEVALQSTDILGGQDKGVYLVYGELRAQQSDLQHYINSPLIKYSQNHQPGEIRLYLQNYKSEACYISYYEANLTSIHDSSAVVNGAYYRIKSAGC